MSDPENPVIGEEIEEVDPEIVHWYPPRHQLPTASPGQAEGALILGFAAVGALAVGAVALGALAIGALAIGRLRIGSAHIRDLEIDQLVVRRLKVLEG